jgi:PAS domain-containing protein
MTNEGTVMQDGDESPVQPELGGFSSGPSAKSASVRSEPGILIFSRRPQLLHMNPRASELTGRFDRAETRSATLALSRLVSELRVQIQDTLDGRIEANVWEPFELRRLMFEFGRKIVLRGFGLPNRNSIDHSRVIIVLEDVNFRRERGVSQAQTTRHSSDRERAAV